ncbi:hypothetical protein KXW39_007872 [Aspergillus fumigatus]|nr:hypothetical protein KXX29_008830 [Aspergillus fumigatus]KAH1519640.1 hypothetical protein KXX06_009690 [Aspergillus fumigatus]KAH1578801.1 hypothetical protein KXX17_006038 [Aspergillus fumigatus]KAH1753464.1 hypothetical protein KXX56_008801 [Aspergillus fumigatus]KAH2069024.1 hypothetical protein KXX03_009551 [Aspergillus fumigatus]
MSTSFTSRPAFNHVGISVPDCDAAVQWYNKTFGYELLRPVLHVKRKEMPEAFIFKIFDEALKEFKIAWLVSENCAVGLELFQFIEPKHRRPEGSEFDYCRSGFFHVSITVQDPVAVSEVVVAGGGSKLAEPVSMPWGNVVVYVRDPWGNTIELLDGTFRQIVSAGQSQ